MSLAQSFLKPEDPSSKRFSALARETCTPPQRCPQRILSWYGMRVTCEFGLSDSHRLSSRGARKFLVDLYRAARAMCRRPTRDRHHRRSGVSARRSVPPRSRSDQPFWRCARKCLDTHTETHKHDPANFFSATHRRKSSFIRTCYGTFYSLRFWNRGRHCLALRWAKIVDIAKIQFNKGFVFYGKGALPVCTCTRAPCTPPHSNIRYLYMLTEINHCPNFHTAARSKFPEIRGPAAYTYIARELCTTTTHVMHHRIALVELYQFTKFHVASSKVPESKSAYANV